MAVVGLDSFLVHFVAFFLLLLEHCGQRLREHHEDSRVLAVDFDGNFIHVKLEILSLYFSDFLTFCTIPYLGLAVSRINDASRSLHHRNLLYFVSMVLFLEFIRIVFKEILGLLVIVQRENSEDVYQAYQLLIIYEPLEVEHGVV